MNADPYKPAYDGTSWFKLYHDGAEGLRRWFHNYRCNKDTPFAAPDEMIVINDEKVTTTRGRTIVRYRGSICDEYEERVRKVDFEFGAPPPPLLFMPVREHAHQRIRDMVSPTGRNRQYLGPDHHSYWEAKMRLETFQVAMQPIFVDHTHRVLQHMLMNERVVFGMDLGGKDSTVVAVVKPPEPKWRRNQ